MSKNPREILILGAGFGGVYTARYLGKMLKPDLAVRVDTYPVRVEDGVVLVKLEASQEQAA